MAISLFIKALVISIVEGLTEFVPVSSTGHMILLGNFIEFTTKNAATFEIFIQAGAILAAVIVYKDEFLGLIPRKKVNHDGFFKQLFWGESRPNGLQILVAILPILIVGLLLHDVIKGYLFGPVTVCIGLIVGGILMIIVEFLPITQHIDRMDDISLKQALLIGIGQCLAVWPGMSRSGSTMITGLLVGVKHKTIADFSFIIAVPVMIAAVSYDTLKSWQQLSSNDFLLFAVGFVVAFFVAWLSIKWFLKILGKIHLIPFGVYRILIGCLILWIIL